MNDQRCVLLSGMPCDYAAAANMFASFSPGSYAEEWVRVDVGNASSKELTERYAAKFVPIWNEVATLIGAHGVTCVKNATSDDLAAALDSHDVIVLLAHHVEVPIGNSLGIELTDGVLDHCAMAMMSPMRDTSVVHLGVCRSSDLISSFKTRCDQVRVIATLGQVDPEAFLLMFAATVQLWRCDGNDYVDALFKFRMSMLDSLGAP